MLRATRPHPTADQWVSVSSADPLNLVGILTPGPRLAALTGNRLLYRDGLPVAALTAGEVQFLQDMDVAAEWEAQKALLRAQPAPATMPEGTPDARAVRALAALSKRLRARSQAL